MYFLKNKFYFFLVAVIIFSCKNDHEKNGDSSKNKDADSTIAEKRNLVSVRRAVIMPAPAGSPKILNVSNPLVFQTNTHVHAVAEPVVIALPEKLIIATPGTDTFPLPKKILPKEKSFCANSLFLLPHCRHVLKMLPFATFNTWMLTRA